MSEKSPATNIAANKINLIYKFDFSRYLKKNIQALNNCRSNPRTTRECTKNKKYENLANHINLMRSQHIPKIK